MNPVLDPEMKLTVNGSDYELADAATVGDLIRSLDLGDRRVAVALNGAVVPRNRHRDQPLQDGDRVEVIHAVAGG